MWQKDFRSKKSHELIASAEASEESEFLPALNVNETPKYEQIECFHRIVCHGRYVLAVLQTEFGKSAINYRFYYDCISLCVAKK